MDEGVLGPLFETKLRIFDQRWANLTEIPNRRTFLLGQDVWTDWLRANSNLEDVTCLS
jgi:hypothetical protein